MPRARSPARTYDTTTLERVLFAVAIAAFGAEYFIYGRPVLGLPPAPPWAPGGMFLAYGLGAVLALAGLGMAKNDRGQICALAAGITFTACFFGLHLLHARDVYLHGNLRTGAFETLALGAAAFVLAPLLPREPSFPPGWRDAIARLAVAGRYAFALSMIVFGVQHYMYAPVIATLVPAWLPAHLFWTYVSGTGFIFAGVAIAINVRASLAGTLLGLMFLVWVLALHLPRSLEARTNLAEWTSLFIALGLAGASLIVARSMSPTAPKAAAAKRTSATR